MLDILIIVVLVVVGAGLALLVFRRKPADASRPRGSGSAAPSRENMLQIVIPASAACCAAARRIETHRFYKHQAPSLPLADCSMKPSCHCRFQPVPDRRLGDRRMGGHEKRESIRFEENPRRQGKGRREVDKLFDHEPK